MVRKKGLRSLSKMSGRFFRCLEGRSWKDGRDVMRRLRSCEAKRGRDWLKGYVNALNGMLVTLEGSYSSTLKPLILEIEASEASEERLKGLKKNFYDQSRRGLHSEFDKGYFRAWYEYTQFLLDEIPRKSED